MIDADSFMILFFLRVHRFLLSFPCVILYTKVKGKVRARFFRHAHFVVYKYNIVLREVLKITGHASNTEGPVIFTTSRNKPYFICFTIPHKYFTS